MKAAMTASAPDVATPSVEDPQRLRGARAYPCARGVGHPPAGCKLAYARSRSCAPCSRISMDTNVPRPMLRWPADAIVSNAHRELSGPQHSPAPTRDEPWRAPPIMNMNHQVTRTTVTSRLWRTSPSARHPESMLHPQVARQIESHCPVRAGLNSRSSPRCPTGAPRTGCA